MTSLFALNNPLVQLSIFKLIYFFLPTPISPKSSPLEAITLKVSASKFPKSANWKRKHMQIFHLHPPYISAQYTSPLLEDETAIFEGNYFAVWFFFLFSFLAEESSDFPSALTFVGIPRREKCIFFPFPSGIPRFPFGIGKSLGRASVEDRLRISMSTAPCVDQEREGDTLFRGEDK